jgi:hypothetical protein
MSHRYRYTGEQPLHLPTLGLTIQPGHTFELDGTVNHPDFEVVHEKKAKEESKAHK